MELIPVSILSFFTRLLVTMMNYAGDARDSRDSRRLASLRVL